MSLGGCEQAYRQVPEQRSQARQVVCVQRVTMTCKQPRARGRFSGADVCCKATVGQPCVQAFDQTVGSAE